MGNAILARSNRGTGSSIEIDGIIREYKVAAGEKVSTGGFVSYVERALQNDSKATFEGQSSTSNSVQMIHLKDNRYMLLKTWGNSNRTLCFWILDFTETDIKVIVAAVGKGPSYALDYYGVRLSDSSVFIVYNYYSDDKKLKGFVVTIDSASITVGKSVILNTAITTSSSDIFAHRVDGTHAVAYMREGNKEYLIPVSVSGTTCTPGTPTTFDDVYTGYSNAHPSLTSIGNKIIVSSVLQPTSGSNYAACYHTFTVSTAITRGNNSIYPLEKRLSSVSQSMAIDSNHVFHIIQPYGETGHWVASVLSLSGSTVTRIQTLDVPISENTSHSATYSGIYLYLDDRIVNEVYLLDSGEKENIPARLRVIHIGSGYSLSVDTLYTNINIAADNNFYICSGYKFVHGKTLWDGFRYDSRWTFTFKYLQVGVTPSHSPLGSVGVATQNGAIGDTVKVCAAY